MLPDPFRSGSQNFSGPGIHLRSGFYIFPVQVCPVRVFRLFFAYNYLFSLYLRLGSMLERLVLKNAADCTSQRLKQTSGVRVILFGVFTFYWKQTSRQADKRPSRKAAKQTSRRADKQTCRQADKQTSRQAGELVSR